MTESNLYKVGEFLYRIVLLNVFWLVMTCFGIGILGLFPASSALAQYINEIRSGKKDDVKFYYFFSLFKKNFIKSNVVSYILLFAMSIFMFNSIFFKTNILILSYMFLFAALVIMNQLIVHLFTINNHVPNLLDTLKNSLIMVFINPSITIKVIFIVFFYILVYYLFPILIIVLGISVPFWTLSINYQKLYDVLQKME